MRLKVGLSVAAAMLLLAGCQKTATNNSAGGNATADGNGTATAESNVVTRDWVIGRWATSPGGACADAIEYKADGSFPALSGATWSLAGTQLTVNVPGNEPQVKTVTRMGPDAMRQAMASGSYSDFTRCH